MIEEGEGICQKNTWREAARRGEELPWDSRLGYERRGTSLDVTTARHDRARGLCQCCPVLEACEQYLSDMERAGVGVDGVIAGRYSDTPTRGWNSGPKKLPPAPYEGQQTHCRACRTAMWPQAADPELVATQGGPRHLGEGLCEHCYPRFARHGRRRC
ncbi:hypothetical protein [Corynebacterium wankanglinii]|uniref:4Fe-4S Wbl-type domain-containing protein n=1 Tax=Corynebacterium wankanglinii TaxID=2735136 RepID=A0A838CHU3_9CORY|nr:hypothetical protein [Corynebacterium wankanglinii]MBA1834149.1 hypothetical protein [Corynebacterium wankanglinii]